ncbi:RNA polymerase sigma factor [Paraconexibacter sp. AEG42_29]|uniref:RNA polymerase sigma factor n=1 Tax=Paraconexibacter sp. AEG42_29 TaxID=2997339 RepID=A0AAU7AXN1_9ACTN
MTAENPEPRFRALFADTERDLLAYALRRVDRAEDAADVVAETFLVAWRRLDDVPPGDEARLWLYGVARRQLANQRRGQLRRSRLAARLREELPTATAGVGAAGDDQRVAAVRAALAHLDEEDREILRLTSWEGLTPAEIAAVLQIPGVTVRSRLHRARRRLKAQLDRQPADPAAAAGSTKATSMTPPASASTFAPKATR